MNKKLLFIGFGILILGLFGILYMNNKEKSEIKYVTLDEIPTTVEKEVSALLYVAGGNEKPYLLKFFKDKYKIKTYTSKISVDEANDLLESNKIDKLKSLPAYLVYENGRILGTFDGGLPEAEADEMFRYIYFNEIPASMNYLSYVSSADEFIKKVNSNEYTVSVFGYNSCSYCNLFKPIINNVAKEYELPIYYFDTKEYDEEELALIYDLDFEIPGTCTTTGQPTSLLKGFPKPMTLITKKGKLVGCVKGYVPEEEFVGRLKEFKVLGGK